MNFSEFSLWKDGKKLPGSWQPQGSKKLKKGKEDGGQSSKDQEQPSATDSDKKKPRRREEWFMEIYDRFT